MNRDQTGNRIQTWDGEAQQAVNVSPTPHLDHLLVESDAALQAEALQAEALQTENEQLRQQVAELQQQIKELQGRQQHPGPVAAPTEHPPQAQPPQNDAAERQWLESVLDLLPTPLILVDVEQKRVTFSNQAANAIAGVDIANEVGDTYSGDYHCTDVTGKRIPPDQVPAVRAAMGEKIQGLEINWHTPVGDFPLLVYAETLPAMHHRHQTSMVVFQDIRDRKQLEDQLRESQRFAQQVADATPGILYIYDLIEQRNVYANRQIGEVLGYTVEQVQAMGNQLFPLLMHPDDLATLAVHMERFHQAQAGEIIEREYRMRHANGRWCWLWSRDLVLSCTATGEPHQVIGISHDITDRKEAELAAARAADRTARLQTITAAFSEALTPSDVATVIVDQALEALEACRGAVALLQPGGQELALIRSVGYDPDMLADWQSFPVSAPAPMAEAVRSQRPIFLPSLEAMLAAYPELESLRATMPAGAIATVPLIAEGTVLGGLGIGFTEAQPIGPPDQEFILTLARQCAQAIRRAQLYQAEKAARKNAETSEQRFRFLAESIPQIVWVAQANGFTEYFNQRWFDYTGLTLQESQNAHGSFRHPDDNAHFKAAWLEAHRNKAPFQAEQRIRRADGTYRWHLTRAQPFLDENGDILKWFGSCTDIDDWKKLYQQAEQARQQAEQNAERTARLQAVTAALSESLTPVQVAEVIAQQTVAVLGAAAVLVALLIPQQDTLEVIHYLGHESDLIQAWRSLPMSLASPLTDAVRTRQPQWESTREERIARYPHLEPVYAQTTYPVWISLPLVAEGTSLGGITITFSAMPDLTPDDRALILALTQQCAQAIARARLYEAEKYARAQAEAANRMKDEFLAVLSHELRTPMNPILGWAKLLRQGNLNPHRTAMALETIDRNAQLQVQLIEDLLDVSRILQGKLTLHSAAIGLDSVIAAAIETVRLAVDAKGIHLQTQLEPQACEVLGDAARLQQVVWNLLANAVKFTPPQGQVEIELTTVGPHAQIQVKDTGKGISPAFLPYVFDTFRQADSSTTRTFGGLGLGLAISRHIVELHGGTIEVASPGEGKGATFTVRLPLLSTSSAQPPETSRPTTPLTLQGVRVLVVDDESDNLELATFVLEQAGAAVVGRTSAQEALQWLDHAQPDILLADIGMPQMDGYRLLRQIRQLEANRGGDPIPAIALTAYASEADRRRAMAVGFHDHIAKPIEPAGLLQAVAALVSSPKQGR